ncbi:MAG: phosphate ABC transporter permease subunit PstC [Acidobacteriota bacterium]|jgi:phosphate ABC transporter, permease protein PstC|nr:phosphate ABC transporter permease subunit PstC [Acidobacteriota bacterium]OQB58207.1 MAG: Phosphate transport system permease protein PstC [Candidatus Aminicenantes bacterium ADurb.Bin147]HNQ80236.1 phosphate ABC transporter permease subunit PstC [Candidatus Aminicenantes bacterium]MDD8009879.1 phosphate ABC transporter permease subunit PstC [Acidobacteriota bacterium]MDD8028936.1 phosphate ABC transporter permease subunit PstC [Acidobacteriota bacterium]
MKLSPRRLREFVIERLIFLSGIASIVFVLLIFVFLLREGVSVLKTASPGEFLGGHLWYPISAPPRLGILPLILGSLLVTAGAVVIAVPLGIAAAFYIAEVAPKRLRAILKSFVEVLSAIPSVVLGFIGITVLVPFLKSLLNLPTGLTAFSGSLMLAFMALPTIITISEDAINAVPREYRDGALALGATHWQTLHRVIIHGALPGIIAAAMLGIGRVFGETMAVMMVTGNAAVIPHSLFEPVRTLTATIAAEMGEAAKGSPHYFALFAVGIVLFIISFAINLTADLLLNRGRKK